MDYDDGTWRELSTDGLGNVLAERSPHGTFAYARDALGRLTKAVVDEPGGPIVNELERDAFGRIVREGSSVRGEARETRHAYDAKGRRTERVLPNGEEGSALHHANSGRGQYNGTLQNELRPTTPGYYHSYTGPPGKGKKLLTNSEVELETKTKATLDDDSTIVPP